MFSVFEFDGMMLKDRWFLSFIFLPSLQLLPGKSFYHSCSLVFLYAGQFMISISCTETGSEESGTSNKDAVSVSTGRTLSVESTRTNLKRDNLRNCVKRSWTYSPPIKINVV